MYRQIWIFLLVVATLAACAYPGPAMYRHDLNDDIVARVSLGQSEHDVTALLGPPFRQIRFDNLKSTALDYRYRDTWGYWVEFSVMMGDEGRVVNRVSKRLDPIDRP